MDDFNFNDIFSNAMPAIVKEFCFSITPEHLTEFLDFYKFDYSMHDLSLLISLCSRPVDIHGFAFAVYMCSGSHCKLQTQKQIDEALIAFKKANFTLI